MFLRIFTHCGDTHPNAHFPSHHCPITLHIPSVATPEPVTILEHRRRFRLFPPHPERLTDKYNMAFARAMGSASPPTVPHQLQHIREALVEAARTVYGEPVAYDRQTGMVRQQHDSLKAFLLSHPFWWKLAC